MRVGSNITRKLLVAVAVVAVLALLTVAGVWVWYALRKEPPPFTERCGASVNGHTVSITPEQAHNAGIITGVSIKRGLKPRAASIALATVYQESNMRNLDYGHSDSIGLFQQRPSQGWGTVEEIMDPWYSSKEFYKALVRVKEWDSKDINDVAQAVQRSAYPEAYRKHVDNARALASALTGETPAAFNCSLLPPGAGDPKGMKRYLTKSFGDTVSVKASADDLLVTADSTAHSWAVAAVAIAGAKEYSLARIEYGQAHWDRSSSPNWTNPTGAPSEEKTVRLVFPENTGK
jgi:hypothetical protein